MPDFGTLDYLRRREAQECELAHNSSDPSVKRIHFSLAETFAERIDAIKLEEIACND